MSGYSLTGQTFSGLTPLVTARPIGGYFRRWTLRLHNKPHPTIVSARRDGTVSTRSAPRTRPHHGCRAQHRLRRTQPAAWVTPEPLCVLSPQATVHADLHYLQVRTPRMPYKGQKATKAVRSGTTPIKPTQRIGPCKIAIREKSPSATTILTPRSMEPTFLFTEIPPVTEITAEFSSCQ